MKIVMTTLLGVEAITGREMQDLGFDPERVNVRDGQVLYEAGEDLAAVRQAVARCNVQLATAERVLLQLAQFPAETFDALFDQVQAMPWEEWIPPGHAIEVNGYSRKSKLYGIPACQRLIKKAIVNALLAKRKNDAQILKEDPALGRLRVQFSIVQNTVSVMIDTSGDGLHKRGYRPLRHEAPIRETLAAAMLRIARYSPDQGEALLDPCCGSGTIPIEAARMAAGIAPGLQRRFAAESWPYIGAACFVREKEAAAQNVREAPSEPLVFGSDLSAKAIDISRQNAQHAKVDKWISLKTQDLFDLEPASLRAWIHQDRILVLSNPPYGERLLDENQAKALLQQFGRLWLKEKELKPPYRMSIISPQPQVEDLLGSSADKRRKLYNGMIPCTLYQYFRHGRRFK